MNNNTNTNLWDTLTLACNEDWGTCGNTRIQDGALDTVLTASNERMAEATNIGDYRGPTHELNWDSLSYYDSGVIRAGVRIK